MSENSKRLLKNSAQYITSHFGYRTNPVTGKKEGHNGTDYGTNYMKVPCYAIDNGTVVRTAKDGYGGKFVYVRFPKLSKVGLYYHLDKIHVYVGQNITPDTIIGIVGKTGQSTGVHLHFSLIQDNSRALSYYGADYLDYEKYKFPTNPNQLAVAKKYSFDNNTMDYLSKYKFKDSLFTMMLKDSKNQFYEDQTIDYIMKYKFGKEIFVKLKGLRFLYKGEVQKKYDFDDNTMLYLMNYKFADALLEKMLKPVSEQNYDENTIKYISDYKFGKEVLNRMSLEINK